AFCAHAHRRWAALRRDAGETTAVAGVCAIGGWATSPPKWPQIGADGSKSGAGSALWRYSHMLTPPWAASAGFRPRQFALAAVGADMKDKHAMALSAPARIWRPVSLSAGGPAVRGPRGRVNRRPVGGPGPCWLASLLRTRVSRIVRA